ncbi:MAG: response regulator [Desulfotomaculaceae bacterium]|nr:response regulator [Desulfotomaculaceae bacterium]
MGKAAPHILVVDDNPGIRLLLTEALTGSGYKVETAASGAEAINQVRDLIPELILLDVKMPKLSGLETLAEIHKLAPGVPVIMMTAYSEMSQVWCAIETGQIECFLKKPFDLFELEERIKNVLSTLAK